MKEKTKVALDEWQAALDAVMKSQTVQGETLTQLRVRWGNCSKHTAQKNVDLLIEAGKATKARGARGAVYQLTGNK